LVAFDSVNQIPPFRSTVIARGAELAVGTWYSSIKLGEPPCANVTGRHAETVQLSIRESRTGDRRTPYFDRPDPTAFNFRSYVN
jgi:hypothetical protein